MSKLKTKIQFFTVIKLLQQQLKWMTPISFPEFALPLSSVRWTKQRGLSERDDEISMTGIQATRACVFCFCLYAPYTLCLTYLPEL